MHFHLLLVLQFTSLTKFYFNVISCSASEPPPYLLFQDRTKMEPHFDNTTSTNITTAAGKSVFLPCRVHQIGDRTVSWIRRRDLNVLTVGKYTYTPDQRFQAVHMENSDDWSLQIGYTSKSDAGIYECQVSTRPPKSLFVNLNIVVSQAKIFGSPTIYFNSESTINLTCIVDGAPGPPDFIFWYHNGEVINYNSPRKIKVQLMRGAQAMSILTINKSIPSDSGNYSCVPANADSAHIAVHVLNNGAGQPAAMQHGKRSAESLINSSPLRSRLHPCAHRDNIILIHWFHQLNRLIGQLTSLTTIDPPTASSTSTSTLTRPGDDHSEPQFTWRNFLYTLMNTFSIAFCLPLWVSFVKDFQSIR